MIQMVSTKPRPFHQRIIGHGSPFSVRFVLDPAATLGRHCLGDPLDQQTGGNSAMNAKNDRTFPGVSGPKRGDHLQDGLFALPRQTKTTVGLDP